VYLLGIFSGILIVVHFSPLFLSSISKLGLIEQDTLMHQSLSSSTGAHDSDGTEEPVLVEAQEFSDDDESFAKEVEEDDRLDIDYDEEEEDEEEEDDFEDDDDEGMSLVRVGLHDLNTLRHLYRFGLLATNNSMDNVF
jgi:hypothetical protein